MSGYQTALTAPGLENEAVQPLYLQRGALRPTTKRKWGAAPPFLVLADTTVHATLLLVIKQQELTHQN